MRKVCSIFMPIMIRSYFKYLKNRKNAHGIHSPFVFEFYNAVLKESKKYKQLTTELIRNQLKKNNTKIEVNDLGAGSRKNNSTTRTIAEITKNTSVKKKYGQLLHRITYYYEHKNILEFGTSVGIGTQYLVSRPYSRIITFEGCEAISKIAEKKFKHFHPEAFDFRVGEFSDLMPTVGDTIFDLIFIDGNHTYSATMDYFKFALAHTHNESFIILDDIHWSKGMERAWEEIKKSTEVNVTMDLFQFGICCKRVGQRKEHFILKY